MPSKNFSKLYDNTAPNGLCAWFVLMQAYAYTYKLDSMIPRITQDDLQQEETRHVIKGILQVMMPEIRKNIDDEQAKTGLTVLTEYTETSKLDEHYDNTYVLVPTLAKLLAKFKIDANIWLTGECQIGSGYDKGEYRLDTIVRNGLVEELPTVLMVSNSLRAHQVIDIAESGENGRRVVNIFEDGHFYICTSDDVKFNVDKVKVWGKK